MSDSNQGQTTRPYTAVSREPPPTPKTINERTQLGIGLGTAAFIILGSAVHYAGRIHAGETRQAVVESRVENIERTLYSLDTNIRRLVRLLEQQR